MGIRPDDQLWLSSTSHCVFLTLGHQLRVQFHWFQNHEHERNRKRKRDRVDRKSGGWWRGHHSKRLEPCKPPACSRNDDRSSEFLWNTRSDVIRVPITVHVLILLGILWVWVNFADFIKYYKPWSRWYTLERPTKEKPKRWSKRRQNANRSSDVETRYRNQDQTRISN